LLTLAITEVEISTIAVRFIATATALLLKEELSGVEGELFEGM
jgi:hypothetical protein